MPDSTVITATADIVAVASHVDNDHKTVDAVENGRTVKRCSIYPNISCEDHIRTSEVGKKYLSGRWAAPVSLWCDASGKEMFRKYGFRQPDAFKEDLKDALGRVKGERIAKAEYDKQAIPLEDAQNALSQGKYRIAVDGFTAAAKGSIEELRKSAEIGLTGLKRTGEGLLGRGRTALDAGRKDKARELLAFVAEEFANLDCGREAAELLKKAGVEEVEKDKK